MSKAKILVVEDERDINELIQYNLEAEGYTVIPAYDGQEALDILEEQKPDAVILDIMMPEMDGRDVCRALKQNGETKNIPIMMVTAKNEESDVLIGLELGADDYLAKPFSPKVLIARLKALLRRTSGKKSEPQAPVYVIEDMSIDSLKRKIKYKDKFIDLTPIEFNILEFLARHPGRVFSRDQIMDSAWKEGKFIVDRAVDVHIRSLRKKLGRGAKFIETVHGIGYRFKEPGDD